MNFLKMRAVQRGIFRLPRRALRRSARLLQRFQPLRAAHDHKDAERDGERADGKSRRCAHGQKGFARFAAESRDHRRFQGEQGDGGVRQTDIAEGLQERIAQAVRLRHVPYRDAHPIEGVRRRGDRHHFRTRRGVLRHDHLRDGGGERDFQQQERDPAQAVEAQFSVRDGVIVALRPLFHPVPARNEQAAERAEAEVVSRQHAVPYGGKDDGENHLQDGVTHVDEQREHAERDGAEPVIAEKPARRGVLFRAREEGGLRAGDRFDGGVDGVREQNRRQRRERVHKVDGGRVVAAGCHYDRARDRGKRCRPYRPQNWSARRFQPCPNLFQNAHTPCSVTVNALPLPTSLSTEISPPMRSMTFLTSASPSPLPSCACERSP